MRVRQKLVIVFFSMAVIPVFFVGRLSFVNSRDFLVKNITEHLEVIADLKVEKIETFFNELKRDIAIAQDYHNIKANLPIITAFYGDGSNPEYSKAKKILDGQLKAWLKVREELFDFVLICPEGKVVYTANEAHAGHIGGPLPDPTEKAFQEGKKGIYISEIFKSRASGYDFGLFISAPVYGFDNKFIGVVAFEINMAPVYKFIQDTTGLGVTGETLLVRKEGSHVLYLNSLRHAPDAALKKMVVLGDKIATPAQEAALKKTGSGITVDYQEKEALAAWRYIPSLDWGLLAKMDLTEVMVPVFELWFLILIICLFVFVMAGIAALSLADSIAKPIHLLYKGTEIIGNGNLDYKVGIDTKDEIGQLARAFDQMTGNLKKMTASRDELNREITERRKAKEALQASELRYRRLFEAAKDGILILDAETGKVVDVNPFLIELLGFSREQLEGKNIWELGFLKDSIANQVNLLELQQKGYIRYEDLPLETADGRKIDVEFVSNVYQVNHHKVIQCNIRDITHRKMIEEELKKKMRDLEIFNKAAVGRELKMKELKARIKELEEKLGEKA